MGYKIDIQIKNDDMVVTGHALISASLASLLSYLSELYGIGHQHSFIYHFFALAVGLVIISSFFLNVCNRK